MGNKRELLLPNSIYHIYNHGIGNSDIFIEAANYEYFLDLYKKHISPFTRLYAFCLLPNHFHIVLKLGNYELIEEFIKLSGYKFSAKRYANMNNKIAQLFGNFFNAYAKAINKRYKRMGSLFVTSFKRKTVLDEEYLRQLVLYVNNNPVHHSIAQELEDWPYSSFMHIIHKNSFIVDYNQNLSLFNSPSEFRIIHKNYSNQTKQAGKTGPFNLEITSTIL
jgi:REP element-mobilizing transposase RayT